MRTDISKHYSDFYRICLTQRYRDTLLFWLRKNQPAAYARVVKDHHVT